MTATHETTEDTRDRLVDASQSGLGAQSLVGSFFCLPNEWQGCVVAEVAPQVYLCELFEWLTGTSSVQRLVRLDDMFDWRFYDTAQWMRASFETQRERAEH